MIKRRDDEKKTREIEKKGAERLKRLVVSCTHKRTRIELLMRFVLMVKTKNTTKSLLKMV